MHTPTRLLIVGTAACLLVAGWYLRERSEGALVHSDRTGEDLDRRSDDVLLDHYATAEGGEVVVRSDWAARLYQRVGDPGNYRPGESPDTRPFDSSDPEMQAFMGEIYAVGGCARPGVPCEPARQRFRRGGDRLAQYLIRQLVESERGGWPNNDTYLAYIAYTESETGFQFIKDRIAHRDTLSMSDQGRAFHALSKSAHPDAVGVALDILNQPGIPGGYYPLLTNVLFMVPVATGQLQPEALEMLQVMAERGSISGKAGLRALGRHFDLETLEPLSAETVTPKSP